MALLYASKTLEEVKSKNASFDQKIGVEIVQRALQMPLKTIANNAGAPAALYQTSHCTHLCCSLGGLALALHGVILSLLRICDTSMAAEKIRQ